MRKVLVAAPLAAALVGGAVAVLASNAGAAGAPSLVAAYSFDDGAGRYARDQSGHGHDAELRGATWTTGQDGFGQALHLDGTSARAVVPASSALDLAGGYTIEAWARPDSEQDGWRNVLLRERAGGLSWGLYANDDDGLPTASLNTGDSDENLQGTDGLAVGEWSHLAATYDAASGALVFYVNGTQVASTELAGAPNTDDAGDLSIGGNSVWGEFFAGDIDNVRIWDGPVNAARIAELRDTPVDTPALDAVITAPAVGTIGGTTVLTGRGHGGATISSVRFTLDGANLGAPVSARGGTGSLVFDTTTVTPGRHTVAVTVTTNTGTTATSVPNVLTVAPTRADLRGAWGFNDGGATGSPNIYDYSGHHNDGRGDDMTYSPGDVGTGIHQNGEVGLVEIPDADGLSPTTGLTISAWVKPQASLGGWQPLVSKQAFDGSPAEYGLYASRDDNGVLTGVITTSSGTFVVEGLALTLNEATTVALTYDGSALSLFVDGDQVASEPATGTITAGAGNVHLLSGLTDQGVWRTYFGVLDSVRVYDHALTGEELDNDNTPI